MNRPWMQPIAVFLSWTMLFFSLPVSLSGQQDTQGSGKLVIAIIDLEGRGISSLEAATLTDRMRSELVGTGAVTVVELSLIHI